MAGIFEKFTSPVLIGWIIIALLIVLVGIDAGMIVRMPLLSSFTNDPNNIRQYQLVGDQSQSDRQADSIARAKQSSMTGSRDIPVFFQDYDYDMTLSKTGLSNTREGLTDPSVVNKLNKLGG